jgi:hypothetical protein
LDGCENKGVAGKGIRKVVKTKGQQIRLPGGTEGEPGDWVTELQTDREKRVWKLLIPKGRFSGVPRPGCFGKRGCKRLKTKDGSRKKRAKRRQEVERKDVEQF